jgi:hypothetical protein
MSSGTDGGSLLQMAFFKSSALGCSASGTMTSGVGAGVALEPLEAVVGDRARGGGPSGGVRRRRQSKPCAARGDGVG